MFATKQIQDLFDKIADLEGSASNEGCESDLVVVDSAALLAVLGEVFRLKRLNQRLVLGCHAHRHGDSMYSFLVPQGTVFERAELEANLQEKFEPDRDEFLTVQDMDEPKVVVAKMELKPISFSGGVKSISDDDLCSDCQNCAFRPGEMSSCSQNWPGMEDPSGYVKECAAFNRVVLPEDNVVEQCV